MKLFLNKLLQILLLELHSTAGEPYFYLMAELMANSRIRQVRCVGQFYYKFEGRLPVTSYSHLHYYVLFFRL